jgi:hypothetical protein
MPTTSNFGWTTPADTDLVKDGAAAIRTLGNGIDTSFLDLKGGTTDQVLAKNSNTDLDFKWVADASGIPATIFDAKGDLIAASGADTAARLASSGVNGNVLTVDTGETTGLKWAAPSAGSLTLITKSTFSASASHSVENCFSATYNNYLLLFKLRGSTTNQLRMRLRVSGADSTSSIYVNSGWYVAPESGSNGAGFDNNVSSWALAATPTTDVFYTSDFTIFNPFLAEYTQMQGILTRYFDTASNTDVAMQTLGAWHKAATSYTGFTLFPDTSGTITGEATVYGYQIS